MATVHSAFVPKLTRKPLRASLGRRQVEAAPARANGDPQNADDADNRDGDAG